MKGYRHVFIVFLVFILTAGVLYPDRKVFAKENNQNFQQSGDFKISVKCGIDGYAEYDYPTMVQVSVESKYNFAGLLQVIPEGINSYSKVAAYGEDISLTANQAKTFTFYVMNPGNAGSLKVELLNEKGKPVYSQPHHFSLSEPGAGTATSRMVGILSDDYNALNYLDGISLTLNNVYNITGILELTKDTFPADSGALSVLHYIIIDNYDTANLSDEQYATLKEWVNNGGVLILALGSNYQNVLHRFSDDFVTGTIGSLGKKNLQWTFSQYDYQMDDSWGFDDVQEDIGSTDQETDTNTDSVDIQEAEPDHGEGENEEPGDEADAELENEKGEQIWTGLSLAGVDALDFELESGMEMIGFSTDQTAYYRDIGLGRVVVLAYSLGMEPMTGYSENAAVVGKLLTVSAADAASQNLNNTYSGRDYSELELAAQADTTRKPSALLYGAVLLLYVVLVGPILYLILKAVKKREKIWIAIPIVVLVFTGIIFLTSLLYRVNKPLVNTFSFITLEEGYKTEKVYTRITCPKAKQYTVAIQPEYGNIQYNSSGYDYSLFDTGSSDNPFDYMIKRSSAGTELVLNNTSTFNTTTFNVQRTEENDIGTIECDLQCYTAGFEGTVTNQTGYDLTGVVVNFERYYYQIGDLKKGEQITIDQSKLIPAASGGNYTFENLYRNMRGLYSDNKLYTQYKIDTMMESDYVDIDSYGRGCVWAKISSYTPDFIGESSVKQSGIGVLYQTFHADYEDIGTVYYPNIDGMAIDAGGYDTERRSFYSGEPVTVTYSFEGYPGITALENPDFNELGQYNADTGMYCAYVYAMDPKTGSFDQIFVGSRVLAGEELRKYVENNILVLRYEPVNEQVYDNYIPRIIARGEQ